MESFRVTTITDTPTCSPLGSYMCPVNVPLFGPLCVNGLSV